MLLRQSRRLRGLLPQLQCAASGASDSSALAQQLAGPPPALPPAAATICTAPAALPARVSTATLRSAAAESTLWSRRMGSRAGGDKKDNGKPPLVDVQHLGDGEEPDEDAEAAAEAAEGIQNAFDELIGAAYELLAEGKPMEAEYLLSEGAKQAEQVLGEDALELAPLYDQLAIMLFLHERETEAQHAAMRALEILKTHDEPGGPASAIAGVRYAATLLPDTDGGVQKAALLLANSADALTKAVSFLKALEPESDEERQEIEDAVSKFETGLGEAMVYRAIARMALAAGDSSTVAAQDEQLSKGFSLMCENLGPEHPLVGAALREHNRLVNNALEERKHDLAEALYKQEIRLHSEYDDSNDEYLGLLQYQLATLQYVMGKYDDAKAAAEASLAAVRGLEQRVAAELATRGSSPSKPTSGEASDDEDEEEGDALEALEGQLLSVKQRLGCILGAAGEHEAARALLLGVAPDLIEKIGPGNPLTHELNAVLSLAALRELPADAPADRRQQLLKEMEVNIQELGVYGDEHMLVQKAKQLYKEVSGRVLPGGISSGGLNGAE